MYSYFDGDSIGDSIELLLLNGKIQEAKELSSKLNDAIYQLKMEMKLMPNIEIILFGGDDLLIYYDDFEKDMEIINAARNNYFNRCGHYISCGCGNTINLAMENLRKAKLMGKNHFLYNNQIIK